MEKSSKKAKSIAVFILFPVVLTIFSIDADICYCDSLTLINQELTSNNLFDSNFDAIITQFMHEGHIPSLAASIVHDKELLWVKGYGEQSALDTVFMIGSITKSVTSTAILMLYEQGLINLDDDVNDYLPFDIRNPHWPNDSITFNMLLSHRAGLDDFATYACVDIPFNDMFNRSPVFHEFYNPEGYPPYPLWLEEYFSPNGSLFSTDNWLSEKPGDSFLYSNCGYLLLGYLIELVTNQSLEQYFVEHIFEPLNMTNTHMYLANYTEDNLTTGYIWVPENNTNSPLPQYDHGGYGCGGLHSTALDLSKFLLFQMNDEYNGVQLLSQETLDMMHTNQGDEQAYFREGEYGLGWMMDEWEINHSSGLIDLIVQGHGGNAPYFWASMRLTTQIFNNGSLRDKRIGLVLLVNQGFNLRENDEDLNFPDIFEFIIQEAYKSIYPSTDLSQSRISGFTAFTVIMSVIIGLATLFVNNLRKKLKCFSYCS